MTTERPPVGLAVASSTPPEGVGEFARLAEELGFSELWIPEDYFFLGSMACVATALSSTARIPVGAGITSAMVRHPAVAAMEIAALERMFPGRVWPGIGLGLPEWLSQMGLRPKSPLTALRESLTALRALLRGKEVTLDGRSFRLEQIRLAHPPEQVPPLFMGGIGPKMLQLAGEIADGTVVSGMAGTAYLRWLHERVDEGRHAGNRFAADYRVPTLALYAVDHDSRYAKEALRPLLAFFLNALAKGPLTEVYGIADEVGDMLQRGGTKAADLIEREMPDQWMEDLAVAGDPDECAHKIMALLEAGADSVILMPSPPHLARDMLDLTARDVLPQVPTSRTLRRSLTDDL